MQYFIYIIKTKKIVSKPLLDHIKAKEMSDNFNKSVMITDVGHGKYNSKTKKFSDVHYAK